MARYVKTVSEAIEALDGVPVVAALTGVGETAVYHWPQRGFPAETYLVLRHALAQRGYRAPDSLWPRMRPPIRRSRMLLCEAAE